MASVYLTRRERFSAAHRIFRPELTDEENFREYGQCAHPNWHGHNYELFVTVKGSFDPEAGYLINLKTLGKLIQENVTSRIDHKNLNLDVDFMKNILPSTENLAMAIWKTLYEPVKLSGAELHCVKIQETENNYVEFYG